MRIFKPLLAAFIALAAILAGLLVTVAVALGGAFLFLARRLSRRMGSSPARRAPTRPASAAGEAIDVVATEVPPDHLAR